MKIIDAHMHAGKLCFCKNKDSNFAYDLCADYKEIIDVMNGNGIERAVLLPVPHRDFNVAKSNNYIFEAYTSHPDRFIPFCRIDEHLEENLKIGFRGVKLHLVYEDIEISQIKKDLQKIEDANIPLLVHAKFKNKVKQIEEIFKIAPNINIILAHMGRGHLYTGEQTMENALALRKYSNLYMDLSTVGDLKSIINVCEIMGYDKVIYASDYPFGKNYFREKYCYSDELDTFKRWLNKGAQEFVFHKNIEMLTNREKLHVRRVKKTDLDFILAMFESISLEEKKFLAYEKKSSLIRQIIKSERHCYVAVKEDIIVGFLRESGRPEGFSLVEELVVHPTYRNKGVASELLKYYHRAFEKNLAKTHAKNLVMGYILTKNGYIVKNPDALRIKNWIRIGDLKQ